MAFSFVCKDSGADCPGVFTVDMEDELMQHLQLHAKLSHPELEMTPDVVKQFKSVIRAV